MANRQQQHGAGDGEPILVEASCMKEELVRYLSCWSYKFMVVSTIFLLGLCAPLCALLCWSLYVRQARLITNGYRVYLTESSLVYNNAIYNICGMYVSTEIERVRLTDIQTIRHDGAGKVIAVVKPEKLSEYGMCRCYGLCPTQYKFPFIQDADEFVRAVKQQMATVGNPTY